MRRDSRFDETRPTDQTAPEAADTPEAAPGSPPAGDESGRPDLPSRAGETTAIYAAADFRKRYQGLLATCDGATTDPAAHAPVRIILRRLPNT